MTFFYIVLNCFFSSSFTDWMSRFFGRNPVLLLLPELFKSILYGSLQASVILSTSSWGKKCFKLWSEQLGEAEAGHWANKALLPACVDKAQCAGLPAEKTKNQSVQRFKLLKTDIIKEKTNRSWYIWVAAGIFPLCAYMNMNLLQCVWGLGTLTHIELHMREREQFIGP